MPLQEHTEAVGIELDPGRPGEHARYRFFRTLPEKQRERFVAMLLGRDTQQ
jgi:hypothetical protein